jgi:hypothetical protein
MISPKEQADLNVMKAAIEKLKLSCYDGQLALSRIPQEELKHTGHKSVEEGLLYRLKSTQREIETLEAAHILKYLIKSYFSTR